jgi:hypothetical protein
MSDYFQKWMTGDGKIVRLAVGATIFQQTVSDAESIERLSKFLPNIDVSGASSDFVFRINRIMNSDISISRVNRLIIWQSVRYGSVIFDVATGRPVPSGPRELFAAQCLIDINTPPDSIDIAASAASGLASELAAIAARVAREGDVS